MTRRRRLLALAAVVGMLALSGCLGLLTGGSVPDQRLDAEPPDGAYAWNESVDDDLNAHITVRDDATFSAVYAVDGDEIRLFRRDGLGGTNPLGVRAVRYRYPNGTVINGTQLRERGDVDQTRDEVVIELPGEGDVEGDRIAFSADSTPKRFALPAYVNGSYELVLPQNRRTSLPVFGDITPAPASTSIDDRGRQHIRWDEVDTDSVIVQFYLPQDVQIFGGVFAVFVVIAVGGLLYYRRQIDALRERREEMGLDVDVDDDDIGDDGPPPGMR
ncbi:DUF5803 family protein [Halobaculum sp. CBA1158]|uniref:DUF5803 family protein n=1 Tax=Halobaculum sp. CBA1158 TaxID=2904243 RepID=UPI001F45CFBC|nr:DUF5803 family protein [Halobaculum sp. CBA1158]UIO99120.1 DUF5803 family protein [Halobaculum sp. CBA1158]